MRLTPYAQPNKEDAKRKLEPGFGATIMIINGGIECGHGYEKPQATNRQKYYKEFAKYLKVTLICQLSQMSNLYVICR